MTNRTAIFQLTADAVFPLFRKSRILLGYAYPHVKEKENNMAMKVEIKDNKLYIEIDLEEPTPSSSGKTLVVASTRGNTVTTALVNGKPVTIGLNAYIKP